MMTTRLLYTLATIAVMTSGCASMSSIVTVDPRCQARQYCPYTDPPPAVRTEVLRSGSYTTDPAVR